MTKTKKIFLGLLMALGFYYSKGQDSESGLRFGVEVDPATFVFKGYSLHLRIQAKNSDNLLLGVGTYAMNMPDALINRNEQNRDKGWQVRINQAYGLFAEHHFTEVNRKLFAGVQLGIQQFKLSKEAQTGNVKHLNMLAMAYFGYTFRPFQGNFYVKPWAGVGYTSMLDGKNELAQEEYQIAPLTMFVTLHVGYTF